MQQEILKECQVHESVHCLVVEYDDEDNASAIFIKSSHLFPFHVRFTAMKQPNLVEKEQRIPTVGDAATTALV